MSFVFSPLCTALLSASWLKSVIFTLTSLRFRTGTMSQSNASDLLSTIATQLNIVIVALRLLVEMLQPPDTTSPTATTPGTCPSRPPASPASPPFRTTTIPTISWAPCAQPDLTLVLQKTPTPTSTSSAGKRTPPPPPAHPSSPNPDPFPPPSSLLPSPSLPVADEVVPSSPAPLSFPPSPIWNLSHCSRLRHKSSLSAVQRHS